MADQWASDVFLSWLCVVPNFSTNNMLSFTNQKVGVERMSFQAFRLVHGRPADMLPSPAPSPAFPTDTSTQLGLSLSPSQPTRWKWNFLKFMNNSHYKGSTDLTAVCFRGSSFDRGCLGRPEKLASQRLELPALCIFKVFHGSFSPGPVSLPRIWRFGSAATGNFYRRFHLSMIRGSL